MILLSLGGLAASHVILRTDGRRGRRCHHTDSHITAPLYFSQKPGPVSTEVSSFHYTRLGTPAERSISESLLDLTCSRCPPCNFTLDPAMLSVRGRHPADPRDQMLNAASGIETMYLIWNIHRRSILIGNRPMMVNRQIRTANRGQPMRARRPPSPSPPRISGTPSR